MPNLNPAAREEISLPQKSNLKFVEASEDLFIIILNHLPLPVPFL